MRVVCCGVLVLWCAVLDEEEGWGAARARARTCSFSSGCVHSFCVCRALSAGAATAPLLHAAGRAHLSGSLLTLHPPPKTKPKNKVIRGNSIVTIEALEPIF